MHGVTETVRKGQAPNRRLVLILYAHDDRKKLAD